MPDLLPETFGRYRIVKKLGEGGMGAVYLAHDTQMDRDVALKVPRFDNREQQAVIAQFYREARVVAKILHPNVCPVHDVGQIDGVHFLTMAFIDGTELAAAMVAGQPWPPERALPLAVQIAEGLHELHRHGIVHRDLKPGNILLRADGRPVLLDFGLARSVATEEHQLATKSAMQGTPAYMAPEQMAAQPDQIKPWTDVYALGAIFFELLTGQRPFQPTSLVQLCAQVMHAERPRPSEFVPGLSPALDQLCLDTLAIDPAKRPQDMPQLIARLKGCQEAKPLNGKASTTAQCPQCGKRLRIPDKIDRKKARCPACRAPLPETMLVANVPTEPLDAPLPDALAETLRTQLGQSVGHPPRPRGKWALVAVLSAAVLSAGALAAWRAFQPGDAPAATTADSRASVATQETRKRDENKDSVEPSHPQQPPGWDAADLTGHKLNAENVLVLQPGAKLGTRKKYKGPVEVTVIVRAREHAPRFEVLRDDRRLMSWIQTFQVRFTMSPFPDGKGGGIIATQVPYVPGDWYTIYWRVSDEELIFGLPGRFRGVGRCRRKDDVSEPAVYSIAPIESPLELRSFAIKELKR